MNGHAQHAGFTLVEVMVVMAILAVIVGMVGFSVGGSVERERLLAREHLLQDLSALRLESADQGRLLGLRVVSGRPVHYEVVHWMPPLAEGEGMGQWLPATGFDDVQLPDEVSLAVEPLDLHAADAVAGQARAQLLGAATSPRLLWLGDGQALPARLQFTVQGQPLGDPIYVDQAGNVRDTPPA